MRAKTKEREDGHPLILPSVLSEEGGGLSARTLCLSCGCKDNEQTDTLQIIFICKPCKEKLFGHYNNNAYICYQ